MEIERVLHMVGGEGENSYANNSRLQEKAIYRTRSTVEEAVRQICTSFLPEKLVVADLGCSSGPNAFLVMSEIIGAVDEHCCLRRPAGHPPEIQFFLNDLPGNDFNSTFRLLVLYRNQVKEGGKISVPFYAVGLPGSFYGRLFPSRSVHFFHSSYCLMWLSQVPKGLEGEEGAELNAGNIYIAEGCSSVVRSLYLAQFQKDFHNFLKLRSEELLLGGRMVLSFLGRRNSPDAGEPSYMWQLLSEALNSIVLEGLVEKATLDAFNLPFYAPLMEEVKLIIAEEGSFELNQAQTFGLNWDPFDDPVINNTTSGINVAKYIRAVTEPLLVPHFGEQIMDALFSRYAKSVATYMLKKTCKYATFILSLKLKGKSTI